MMGICIMFIIMGIFYGMGSGGGGGGGVDYNRSRGCLTLRLLYYIILCIVDSAITG